MPGRVLTRGSSRPSPTTTHTRGCLALREGVTSRTAHGFPLGPAGPPSPFMCRDQYRDSRNRKVLIAAAEATDAPRWRTPRCRRSGPNEPPPRAHKPPAQPTAQKQTETLSPWARASLYACTPPSSPPPKPHPQTIANGSDTNGYTSEKQHKTMQCPVHWRANLRHSVARHDSVGEPRAQLGPHTPVNPKASAPLHPE